ncbi:MAG: carboxylesterase/lipase family protein [Acidobacteria bacterium]|nr:carboxylesterase/lipase family protein [Acidobacteriota bacterium]
MNLSGTNLRSLILPVAFIAALALLSGCGSKGSLPGSEAGAVAVETSNGPVRGRAEDGNIFVFKGLRYGKPPVGDLRFKPPVRPEPWAEPADAYEYGNRAVQAAGPAADPADTPGMGEDCLFLNVWTPGLDGKNRPVMVWLHGGGFSSGSGGDTLCEGKNLARKGDAVVVTVNHRLNVFGFLQLGDAWGPDYASSGQAGMLDIVLSLEWVRDNIARFGGNPGNVTIFGESGGGRKVAMLMAMPPAAGLFHKAIVQSGSGLDAPSKDEAVALGRALLEQLGIAEGDTEALAKAETRAVFDAQQAASPALSSPDLSSPGQLTVPARGFVPCIDGIALPRKPFIPDAPAISAGIPLLIGSNKDEMSIFRTGDPKFGKYTDGEFAAHVRNVLPNRAESLIPALRSAFPDYSPSDLVVAVESMKGYWAATVMQAERKAAQGAAPVYVYFLAWETRADNGRLRAHHALDVPLVFNNVETMRDMVGPGPEPQRMADLMSSAWAAFARTGNPGTEGLPDWPAYDLENRSTMIFDTESHIQTKPYEEIRRILVQN